jgi:hypothetical protein
LEKKMNREFLPKFWTHVGSKKTKTAQKYETTIDIDNTHGQEDLVELSIYFAVYGTGTTKLIVLDSNVKKGKKKRFVLPKGTHPTAFLLLWKTGSFYRWFGEQSIGLNITTSIGAYWRVEDFDGLKVWGGGYVSSTSQP